VSNKANWGSLQCQVRSQGTYRTKRSQSRRGRAGRRLGDEGQMRKTKPIPARRISYHFTILSFHPSSPAPIVRNKPNWRDGEPAMPGSGPETIVPNEANCARKWARAAGAARPRRRAIARNEAKGAGRPGTRRDEMCKTNPISRGRGIPSFQYSIIPVFQSDADRAKQSQSGRVSGGDAQPTKRRSCETKPILGWQADARDREPVTAWCPRRPSGAGN
jgi:hypothetical protein